VRVMLISKACVVGAYQRKLEELAAVGEMDLMVVVPPYWQEESRRIVLEPLHTRGYQLVVEPVRFNGRFHLFHFPGLGRRMRAFHPDVVHVDEEPYNLATVHAMWLASRVGARSLFFSWQNLHRRYPPPFRWMEAYCYRAASRAIAGSAEVADVLRRKGFARPIDVIPQFGVDPDFFRPLATRETAEATTAGESAPGTHHFSLITHHSPFRIGYVGRLVEPKGILDLIEAVSRLRGPWRLMLVGAGPLQPRVEALARRLGVADRLEILAGLPSARMPEVIGSLDVLVLPSRTRANWKEQFGRVLVEAMACQVPVVGSDSGEIPKVIGDAGLVFPEGDVGALVSHLEALRANPGLRRELGERGRARVLAHFTHAAIARETYEAYRSMLE
jgi:glycosyltransferase involved in cell wall biosynthesis